MKRLWPSVNEERVAVLLGKLRRAAREGVITAGEERAAREARRMDWRSFSSMVRAVLFIFTAICVATLGWLADELRLPYGLVTLIIAVGFAELLIQRRGFYRAGFDEALWLGGCLALVVSLPGPARAEGLLLFALAGLLAGLRLRQPAFLAGAVVVTCSYLVSRSGDEWIVEILGLAIAFVALALLTLEWRDPLIEATLAWLVVVMPIFSYVVNRMQSTTDRSEIVLVVAAITAAGMAATGLSIRHHAPLASALLATGVVLLEWSERSTLLLEGRILVSGGLLFAAGVLVLRMLRSVPRGLTSRSLGAFDEFELVQLAGTSLISAREAHGQEHRATMNPEGGSFGGGGSSGEF